MAAPQYPELFEQGLIDQARILRGLIGAPDGPELDAAVEEVRAMHTRWISGEHPLDGDDDDVRGEHRARFTFAHQPDIFGTFEAAQP